VKKKLNEKKIEKSDNGLNKNEKTQTSQNPRSPDPLVTTRYEIIFKFFE